MGAIGLIVGLFTSGYVLGVWTITGSKVAG
jgi:hypothetical protein